MEHIDEPKETPDATEETPEVTDEYPEEAPVDHTDDHEESPHAP